MAAAPGGPTGDASSFGGGDQAAIMTIVRGRSSVPLLVNGVESAGSAAHVAENALPNNWDDSVGRDESSGNLKNALKIKAAYEEGSQNAMLFWECSLRHFFPGFGLSIEERQDGRLIRKELWARFGQPMHFVSLNFQDDDVEFDYQMDSTRRNKRWVKLWLIGRAILGFVVAAWPYLTRDDRMEGDPSHYALGYFVGLPLTVGILYLFQYLQLKLDLQFSLRYFQQIIFFWSILQLLVVLFFVIVLAPGVAEDGQEALCQRDWQSIGATSYLDVIRMQDVVASAVDQLVKFILSAQILFRMRFIYFLYVNMLMWIVLCVWYFKFLGYPPDSICLPTTANQRLLPIMSLGFAIISYVFELMQRKDYIQADAVLEESERSEELLANVLPKSIVEQLKLTGHDSDHKIVSYFGSVSVLFADIVSFTTMSARLQPADLVSLLDSLFLAFDYLAERNDLEKIKTIGDCYMAAGGIPVKNEKHAKDIARMGLGMIAKLKSGSFVDPMTQIPLKVRVGIHSGPAVAGMIGNKKFAYDLWGDAVNTASRMESHGEPMRVHCSADTFTLLQHEFEMEDRGEMEVKGKGKMKTYFVLREKGNQSGEDDDDDERGYLDEDSGSFQDGGMEQQRSVAGGVLNSVTSVMRTISSLGFASPEDISAMASRSPEAKRTSDRERERPFRSTASRNRAASDSFLPAGSKQSRISPPPIRGSGGSQKEREAGSAQLEGTDVELSTTATSSARQRALSNADVERAEGAS